MTPLSLVRETPDYRIIIESRNPVNRNIRESVLELEESLEKINRFSTEEIVSSFTDLLTP